MSLSGRGATWESVACDANAKKHWLRRREVYLPRGVCFSTNLQVYKGAPSVPRSGGRYSFAIDFISYLTTLVFRDPQGTTRVRTTCDHSLLALSKQRFPLN